MAIPATHKVSSGDTLYSLAKKYGTTVATLKSLNGLKSDLIKIGQILKLPTSTSSIVQAKPTISIKKNIDANIKKKVEILPTKTLNVLTKNQISIDDVAEILSNIQSIELLIAEPSSNKGSQFGHVAFIVNDKLEFGMSTNGWDVREKQQFISSYHRLNRAVLGYELDISKVSKMDIAHSLLDKMKKGEIYNLLDNSCSSALVAVFGQANLNIVDPRWSFSIYSPADIDRFLYKVTPGNKVHHYPVPAK